MVCCVRLCVIAAALLAQTVDDSGCFGSRPRLSAALSEEVGGAVVFCRSGGACRPIDAG